MTTKINIQAQTFGETRDEEDEVTLYTLTSPTVEVSVADYGATIVSIRCPDKNKKMDDIVTGFTGVRGYQSHSKYFGATVGRVCNRIANGKFQLNGTDYKLPVNNGPNSLHGGIKGFDKKMWEAEIQEDNAIIFRLVSEDGEEGYPGKLKASAKFALHGSELLIQYTATTDKDTIVNMTNHAYFNLAGHDAWKEIYDHKITIFSDKMLPVDSTSIPTGEIKDVEGSLFDLRQPQLLTEELLTEKLKTVPGNAAGGYDHNFCLALDGKRKLAARLEHEPSGRIMEVETTEPGIQFYTGNYLGGNPGKHGVTYSKQTALCLETQNWPDAINRTGVFPNLVLSPGETYQSSTWLTFSTSA